MTTSPALRNCGGFMPSPTPGGVPVTTMSPGSSTKNCDRMPDDVIAIEDHRPGVAALTLLAIDVEPHVEVLHVLDLVLGDEPRTDRAERLGAFAFAPLGAVPFQLEGTLGHVIVQEIAGDRVLRLLLGEIARALADHDAKLDFPIEFGGVFGMMVSSFAPQIAVRGLKKTIGSFGTGMPASAAWSE